MKIRPLFDNVIVKLMNPETTTPGGLVIPATAQQKSERAEVLAVGSGVFTPDGKRVELDLKPGNVVILNKFGDRTELVVDGEKVHVVKYASVLAVAE